MKEGKIYVCAMCGNEVEIIKDGGGAIICCGQPRSKSGVILILKNAQKMGVFLFYFFNQSSSVLEV